jgi:hypothetical protein
MKKITVPGVREEYDLVCDVTGEPAVASLKLDFGYGSNHDGQVLVADLSREASNEVLAWLQSRFPQLQLEDYFELLASRECPLSIIHSGRLRLENARHRKATKRLPKKKGSK